MRVCSCSIATTVLIAAMAGAPAVRGDDTERMRALLKDATGALIVSQVYDLFPQPCPDSERATRLWTDIGAAQAKLGQPNAARESFKRAWRIGATIRDNFRRIWATLGDTAKEQTDAGQLREAIEHASGFTNAEERWSLFLNIAAAQELRKDFAGSRKTIEEFPRPDAATEAQIPSLIASSYAYEQNFPAALATCDRIDVDLQRANQIYPKMRGSMAGLTPAERSIIERVKAKRSAVFIVVVALNRTGRFEEARRAAERMKGDASLERYLARITKAAADADQLDIALKAFYELTIPWRRDDVTVSVVGALARTGRFQEASELIDHTQDRTTKASSIFRLASDYARRGDEQSVQEHYARVMALMRGTWGLVDNGQKEIVAGFLSAGQIARAVAFAERIEVELAKEKPGKKLADSWIVEVRWQELSKIYQGMGAVAARGGKAETAKHLFSRSQAAEAHCSRDRFMLRRLVQLAVSEADAGFQGSAIENLGTAFDVAGQIDLSRDAIDDFIQLAAAQAALRQQKVAIQTLARGITSVSQHRNISDSIVSSLQDLSRAQAWIGDVDDAVRVAKEQTSAIARASIEVGIVQGMLARRNREVLLEKQDPLQRSGL